MLKNIFNEEYFQHVSRNVSTRFGSQTNRVYAYAYAYASRKVARAAKWLHGGSSTPLFAVPIWHTLAGDFLDSPGCLESRPGQAADNPECRPTVSLTLSRDGFFVLIVHFHLTQRYLNSDSCQMLSQFSLASEYLPRNNRVTLASKLRCRKM